MPTATVGLAAFELEAERSGFETQRRFLAVGHLQADRSRHLSMLLIRKMRMIKSARVGWWVFNTIKYCMNFRLRCNYYFLSSLSKLHLRKSLKV